MVRISIIGTTLAPSAQLFALPEIAIYGDGSILVPSEPGDFPGPSVPGLMLTKVSEAGLQAILSAAKDAGLLGKNAQLQGPIMPDAATTAFVVVAEGRTHTISAYALDSDKTSGIDAATAAARKKLSTFEAALKDISTMVGTANVLSGPAVYQPTALQVFAVAIDPSQIDPNPSTPPAAWPLATPLASFGQPVPDTSGGGIQGQPMNCGVVTGADLATLQGALANTDQSTIWSSGDGEYTLTFRPQLPDETGCPGS